MPDQRIQTLYGRSSAKEFACIHLKSTDQKQQKSETEKDGTQYPDEFEEIVRRNHHVGEEKGSQPTGCPILEL
jgi:hypothetical protein